MVFGREGSYWIEELPGETEKKKKGLDSKTALPNTCLERYSYTSMVGETVYT